MASQDAGVAGGARSENDGGLIKGRRAGDNKTACILERITMNEQRIEAYLALIERLLTCETGEETEILNANIDLIDAGLVQTMDLVAARLLEEGNEEAGEFLHAFASQLSAAMGEAEAVSSPEDYFHFMGEVLQLVSENPDPKLVYPMLSENVDKLDVFFAQMLQSWAMSTLESVDAEESEGIAGVIGNFSNLIQQFPMGDRGNNLEIAIAGYEIVKDVFSQDNFPEVWAGTQNNLAIAYSDRLGGDRMENLELAIACYEQALQVYTLTAFPEQWAMTQRNLAVAQEEKARAVVS